MRNAWVSPSIFHSTGKCNKTHLKGKTLEISSHTFSTVWVFFSSRFPSCSIIWEMRGISHQLPIAWEKSGKLIEWEKTGKFVPVKIIQNPTYAESLGNWYSYFSHSIAAFFPLDWHPMVYFIICEMYRFPRQFPKERENSGKSIELGESGKLVPIFAPKYGYFSSIRFPSYGILYHIGNTWFFQFLKSRKNKAKSTQWALTLFFYSIIVSTFSKIWWFL